MDTEKYQLFYAKILLTFFGYFPLLKLKNANKNVISDDFQNLN